MNWVFLVLVALGAIAWVIDMTALVERRRRLWAVRVLDRVEERDLVAVAGDRPQLVEGRDRGA